MDRVAGGVRRAIEVFFTVLPLAAVLYLWAVQNPPLVFLSVHFHEAVVTLASLAGLGMAWIALRCYLETGERFALYLSLGMAGFGVLYLFHGAFTRFGDWNPWLFLLYGPASRLALSGCLVAGLLLHDRAPIPRERRLKPAVWGPVALLVGLGVIVVAGLALSPVAAHPLTRGSMEGASMVLCLVGIILLMIRTKPFPMRASIVVAMALFLESSTVFFLTKAWTHVWWGAHVLFGIGFLVLAHGTIRAYLGTRSFATMFSEDEMLARLTRARELERTLRAARDAAEMANRTKTEFLASMSHELRTPLNAVIGFAETMRLEIHGPLGSDRYHDYLENIGQSGAHLLALINDILDVARVEEGRMELGEEELSLDAVAQDALTLVRARAELAKVWLEVVPPPHPIHIWGDPRRLKQVLLNLLSNAVKFTEADGRVRLSWWVDAAGIHMRVSDTGIGIAPADIEKVMTPFGQADSGLSRKYEGSGLGLPLAKAMVELHGGQLTLESTPGRGTTVTLLLPRDRLRLTSADALEPGPAESAL